MDRPPALVLPFRFSALFFPQPWLSVIELRPQRIFSLRLILFTFMLMELMGTFISYCHKLKLYGCVPLSLIYWLDDGPVAPGDG